MEKKGRVSTIQFVAMAGLFSGFSIIFSYELLTTVSVIIETGIALGVVFCLNMFFNNNKTGKQPPKKTQKNENIAYKMFSFGWALAFLVVAIYFFARYQNFIIDFEPSGINGLMITIVVIVLLCYANSLGMESKGRFSFVFLTLFGLFFLGLAIANINKLDITKLSFEVELNGRIIASFVIVFFAYYFSKNNIANPQKTIRYYSATCALAVVLLALYSEMTIGKAEHLGRFPYLSAFEIGGVSSLINIDAVIFSLLSFCGLVAIMFLFFAVENIMVENIKYKAILMFFPLVLFISKVV